MQVDMTLTNHGLIAANDVRLNVANNSFYKIEPLIEDIGILNANSSITVPVKITRIGDSDTPEKNTDGLRILTAQQSEERCIVEICVFWDYDCGADKGKPRKVEKATYVTLVNMEGPCPESGYNYIIPPPVMPNSEFLKDFIEGVKLIPKIIGEPSNLEQCDPCLYEVSNKFFNCYKDIVISLIPFEWVGAGWVKCVKSISGSLKDLENGLNTSDLVSGLKTGLSCTKILGPWGKPIRLALTIIKCGIEIGEATKDCQFSETLNTSNSVKSQSISFGLTTQLNPQSLETIQYLSNSNLQNQLLLFNQHLERLQKIVSAITFPFNESVWFQDPDDLASSTYLDFFLSKTEESTENSFKISDSEKDQILNLPLPIGVTGTDINKIIERWNRTIDYWNAGIFYLSDVPEGQNTDFLSIDVWQTNINAAIQSIEQSQAEGFTNIIDEIEYGYENFKEYLEGTNGGVCSQVKLQINQDAIMTRSAFLGTLDISII